MLQFHNVSLRRGARLLFEQVDVRIHPRRKVGITGANGSGKTSLLALIKAELHSDTGDVHIPKDWVLSHVAQEMFGDGRSAIEFVLDGDKELRRIEQALSIAEKQDDGARIAALHERLGHVGGYTARSRAARLLQGLGFQTGDIDRAVVEFSGGWRMRLNLGRALMCRSDLLLLDEPTNHLDLDAVIWLENWLLSYPGTLLLISHDRDFLDRIVDTILHIEYQRISAYKGNYSAFEQLRSARLANQQSQYVKQQREIAHIRNYVDRFRYKASKARQAQSRLKALQRMEQIAPAHVDSPFHFNLRAPDKLPNPLLRLERAAAGYQHRPVLSGIDLNLAPGDRIGLLGRNGAGKSTLVRLLAGELEPLQGDRRSSIGLAIGYFAQHQLDWLQLSSSATEHMLHIDPHAREQAMLNYLGGFGFSADQASSPVKLFSGGEKSRLILALLVYQRPNLLLLDEPANHLDLEMRQALSLALQDFGGAMVIVSHDRHLLRVTTDRLWLVHDGKVDEFEYSLDEYPRWLLDHARPEYARSGDEERDAPVSTGTAGRRQKRREQAEQRKAVQPLRAKVKRFESQIDTLSREKVALETQLADPQIYLEGNKDKLKMILSRKANAVKELKAAEADWLSANAALEAAKK